MFKPNITKAFAFMLTLGLAINAQPSLADEAFPNKAVKMVIPFAPGGSGDIYGRFLAERLTETWGQSVIVENRGGGGTAIGSAHVSQAEPDGYTFLFVTGSYATAAATQKNQPFDPLKDLTPVALMAVSDLYFMVSDRLAITSMRDLQTKASSETIFGTTSGFGTLGHLTQLVVLDTLGVKGEFVHHKSGGEAQADLAGNRTDVYSGVGQEVANGHARPLAILSKSRSEQFPNVPTSAEEGFPDALVEIWFGVFVPAGTPKAVVDKLNQDIAKAMQDEKSQKFAKDQSIKVIHESPEEFGARVANDIASWKALAARHQITQ